MMKPHSFLSAENILFHKQGLFPKAFLAVKLKALLHFLVSNLFLPLGSLVYLLFCVSRYGWGWKNFKEEANTGEGLKVMDWMRPYLTYVLPVIVLFIFSFGLYEKFVK